MSQFLVVGTVLNNWETGNMVVHPFQLGEAVIEQSKKQQAFRIFKRKHLLETALDWRVKIAANPSIQTASISEGAGVTDGRVRQILRLTKLHQEIQGAILALPPIEAKKRFPEKLLRAWTPLGLEEQLNQFGALKR